MPNVSFKACNNILQATMRKEGKKLGIVANAAMVPASVIRPMELAGQGWGIVRPQGRSGSC